MLLIWQNALLRKPSKLLTRDGCHARPPPERTEKKSYLRAFAQKYRENSVSAEITFFFLEAFSKLWSIGFMFEIFSLIY